MLLVLLYACATSIDPADAGDSADTAACATLTAGAWSWDGACPQMPTPCTLSVSECAVTLDYGAGGMTMGMPYGGTIEGDTITFADDNTVSGCVGTILDADTIEGSCDGCDFTLAR